MTRLTLSSLYMSLLCSAMYTYRPTVIQGKIARPARLTFSKANFQKHQFLKPVFKLTLSTQCNIKKYRERIELLCGVELRAFVLEEDDKWEEKKQ